MSRTSTFTMRGRVVRKNDYGSLLEFIKQQSGSVEIEGCVQGAVVDEDGMDFVSVPVKNVNPFELACQLLDNGRLSTLDCFLEIEGERRYFNFDAHYEDQLVITINSNRRTLRDGTSDFSWYYEKLASKLAFLFYNVENIMFCEIF